MASVKRLQHVSVPMPPGGLAKARAFYGDQLGLEEKVPPQALGTEDFAWFRLGDDGDELHVFTEDGMPAVGQHFCMEVDDIDAWREDLAAKGIEIAETVPIDNRPRFFIRDPFMNRIEITQITGAYTPAFDDEQA
ncbi:MAG TPA: VOC family protein [Thermomicrobiales bacterium]|nr:VOC family protein [Thermomicrobiales bacterium]